MRSFSEIVADAGPDEALAARLGVKVHQPRDWRIRNSIPAEQWRSFSEIGAATLEELARAAEHRTIKAEAASRRKSEKAA